MTDPQAPVGAPTEENADTVDDVVGSAHEGLAEAEAAGRAAADDTAGPDDARTDDASPDAHAQDAASDAAASDAPEQAAPAADPQQSEAAAESVTTDAEPARTEEPAHPEPALAEPVHTEPVHTEPAEPVPAAGAPEAEPDATATAWYDRPAADEPTVAVPAEVAGATAASVAPAPAPQPIFVQAPEAPRPRGNRAAAGAIGLLAAASFAVLMVAVWAGVGFVEGTLHGANFSTRLMALVSSWTLWTPVVVFFIGFWLLGAIINRGRWGHWVVWGLLVGVVAWVGFILGQLLAAPFWTVSASEGVRLIARQALVPLAVASFIIGRELTIWFGAWAAARGRKVAEQNLVAQREYERTLEAGPQLARP